MRSYDGFSEFAGSRAAALLRTAWLLTEDAGAAEDLVQTVLARTRRHWRLASHTDPVVYARKLLYRTYLRRHKGKARRHAFLILTRYEGLTPEQAADVLGDEPATVRRQLPALPPEIDAALLEDSIPDLPHPPDRMESVARRIRSARRRRAAWLAVAVLLLPGTVLAVTRSAAPPADPCAPARSRPAPHTTVLVPAGATSATLCIGGGSSRPGGMSLVLTQHVAKLTDELNALPPSATAPACNLMGLPTTRLVLRYPNRPGTTVDFDRNCSLVTSADAVRLGPVTALNAFFSLYRDQQSTRIDQRSLKPKPCQPLLGPAQVAETVPYDDILRSGSDRTPLPERLAAAALCDYQASGKGLELTRHTSATTGLEPLRSAVNQTFALPQALPNGRPPPDCLDTAAKAWQVTRFDVLWLTDTTGRTVEIRIARAPCAALTSAEEGGLVPGDPLLAALDRRLTS